MAYRHINAARDAGGLDSVARHVLLTLATYTNNAGQTWVGADTLAASTGYAPVTVRRALERAQAGAGLRVVRRLGKTSVYDLRHLSTTARSREESARYGNEKRALLEREEQSEQSEQASRRRRPAAVGETWPSQITDHLPDWTRARLEAEAEAAAAQLSLDLGGPLG